MMRRLVYCDSFVRGPSRLPLRFARSAIMVLAVFGALLASTLFTQ